MTNDNIDKLVRKYKHNFANFGYILEKTPFGLSKRGRIMCYNKDGMFGVIYSDTIDGIFKGVERHFKLLFGDKK